MCIPSLFLVLFCVGFEPLRGVHPGLPTAFSGAAFWCLGWVLLQGLAELISCRKGAVQGWPWEAVFMQERCCAGVALGGGVYAGKVLCREGLGRLGL